MVAKISSGKSIIGLINYNENKVTKGDARLLSAQNMVLGKKESELTYEMKVRTFQRIIDGKNSKKLEKPTFHVSLNFDPTEKIGDNQLREIAGKYMEGIGYSNQPYLVYRHEDTLHPHIHIVSIKVDREGKKINDSFYKQKSEKIRKALEIEFKLLKASEKIKQPVSMVPPLPVTALTHSKGETKKAIMHVVDTLLDTYKMTSLQEFQILLKQYHVNVDLVSGRTREKPYEGLVYSIIDEKGNRVGVGIKASAITGKPTLQNLQKLFAKNLAHQEKRRRKTATEIEKLVRHYSSSTKNDFIKQLADRKITALVEENKQGNGKVTFIDHVRKAVFSDEQLGRPYVWKSFKNRFAANTLPDSPQVKHSRNEAFQPTSGNPDKALVKAASAALISLYNHQLKLENGGKEFESLFISKLHQINMAAQLVSKLPELSLYQAQNLEKKFKTYKQTRLKEIEAREITDFKKHVEKAFILISKFSQLSPSLTFAFLYRLKIDIVKEDTSFMARHTEGEHLKIIIGRDKLQKIVIDKDTLPALDKQNILPFTERQLALLDKVTSLQGVQSKNPNSADTILVNLIDKESKSKATLADLSQPKEVISEDTIDRDKNRMKIKFS